MNTKNNQRFKDTEVRMESAMLELMKTHEFNKITVSQICQKAQVNRSTFYAHFIDIYDMLEKMEIELRKQLLERYQGKTQNIIFSEESFILFLEHIKEHQYFYRITLNTRKSFPLKQGYENLWNIIKDNCYKAGITDEDEILMYLISFQASLTMILKYWVDHDCLMSHQQIASVIKNCLPHIWITQ